MASTFGSNRDGAGERECSVSIVSSRGRLALFVVFEPRTGEPSMTRKLLVGLAALAAVIGLALVEPPAEAQAGWRKGCHARHHHCGGWRAQRAHHRCYGRCNGWNGCHGGYVTYRNGCCGPCAGVYVVPGCAGAVHEGPAAGEGAPPPPPPAGSATNPPPVDQPAPETATPGGAGAP